MRHPLKLQVCTLYLKCKLCPIPFDSIWVILQAALSWVALLLYEPLFLGYDFRSSCAMASVFMLYLTHLFLIENREYGRPDADAFERLDLPNCRCRHRRLRALRPGVHELPCAGHEQESLRSV